MKDIFGPEADSPEILLFDSVSPEDFEEALRQYRRYSQTVPDEQAMKLAIEEVKPSAD